MHAEMQAHLDGLTERNIAAGMSPEDARFAALREFGGVAQIAERARDERRSVWLEQLWQDVRYATRGLARSPSFTTTAVLTLALGIGVNAALFSVVNMVALRPLPVKDPDGLVRIAGRDERGQNRRGFSYDEYLTYRDGNRTLDGLLASTLAKWSFDGKGLAVSDPAIEASGPSALTVELVSENYFSVLGGPLQLGRSFLSEETVPGAAPVILLSHVFWETRLQRDADVIGSTLTLNRQVVTVIGVASVEFSGQQPMPPVGWLPLQLWSSIPADYKPNGRQAFGLIGRMKPGVTEAQVTADLDAIASLRATEFPGDSAKLSVRLERGLRFMSFTRTPEGSAFAGLVVFSFGLVLVIAFTNVANLLLARGISRQSEIGVRLMLGAGRGRIVRQLLTENLLLCVLGAVIGLGLASWTLQLLLPMVVSQLPLDWAMESRQLAFFKTTPDLRVLGFTALLALGATLVVGLLPALHTARSNLVAAAHGEGTAFGRRLTPSRVRQLLVITQVAVSLTLLSCAGLLARKLIEQRRADVGYDAHAVFGMKVLPAATTDVRPSSRQVLETLRDVPGVAAAALANPAPLLGMMPTRIRLVGASANGTEERVIASFISEGFFDTFSISLLRGRTFREAELNSAGRTIVVSETLARHLWPGQEAVGQILAVSEERWASRDRPAPPDAFRECEVIGVARDIMMATFHDNHRLLYLPFQLDRDGHVPVYVRPRSVSGAALAEIVRAAKVEGVELEIERRHSFWVGFYVLPFYAFAAVSGTLGALALGMASVGLYGLMTFAVNQRVREIGIRMALGATTQNVVRHFVLEGMRLVGIGLALGLVGGALFALALAKLLQGFVDAFDPVAFGVVTLLFGGIALFACWLPARRATKVDPVVALRAE